MLSCFLLVAYGLNNTKSLHGLASTNTCANQGLANRYHFDGGKNLKKTIGHSEKCCKKTGTILARGKADIFCRTITYDYVTRFEV